MATKVTFLEDGWEDYLFWQKTDKKIIKRINDLIKDIKRNPFSGIGKPEPLKFSMAGLWSRRINSEHRIVYSVQEDNVVILQCRYHY